MNIHEYCPATSTERPTLCPSAHRGGDPPHLFLKKKNLDPRMLWVFELLMIVVFKLTEDFGKQRSPDASIHALKLKIKIHSDVAFL